MASEINEKCVRMLPGDVVKCQSADSCCELDDECNYPTEFLNTIQKSGVADHEIHLKTGVPIMLIRNLDPKNGLCNGVRLIVEKVISNKLILARKFGTVETHFIPRITFHVEPSESMPFRWKRRQFPIKLGYALTIYNIQ